MHRVVAITATGLVLLSGCASSELARQRKELGELREQLAQLRDDVTALQDLFNKKVKPTRAQRVKVIGRAQSDQQITVLADGVLVNGNEVTMEMFREFIAQLAQQSPDSTVTVISKRTLSRARVDAIVKELHDAGLRKIRQIKR
jgi:biopolymer transport protein ExbD